MSRKGFPQSETSEEDCFFQWSYPGGSVVPYHLRYDYTSYVADKIGGNTPGWPVHVQENDYTAFSATQRFSPATISGYNISDGGSVSGQYPMSLISGTRDLVARFSDFGWLKTIATDRIISKIAERTKGQNVNAMLVAAEAGKTAQTILSAVNRIRSAYESIRNRNIVGALNTLAGGKQRKKRLTPPNSGSAAKDWLAIQYGWRPLLNDVHGACQELAEKILNKQPAERSSARGGATDKVVYVRPPIGPLYPPCKYTIDFQYAGNGAVEYSVGDAMSHSASSLGLTNPLSVVWELVPYSFVVDWFAPVGSFLNNLDYDNGLIFRKGYLVVKAEAKVTIESQGGTFSDGSNVLTWSGGSQAATGVSYERTGMGGFPSVPTPRFKSPLSVEHALNAIALMRTGFSSGNYYR